MSGCYFDTSAYFKRYSGESGAGEVIRLILEAPRVVLSDLTAVELSAAMRRLVREQQASELDYRAFKAAMLADFKAAEVLPLGRDVVSASLRCLEQAPLRGADAVHVATAIVSGCGRFVSADRQQCQAARALGLEVEEIPC